jgi:NAD(P)-dependent dehydrogenase (short-subunit alcohol dehydrogenase family)
MKKVMLITGSSRGIGAQTAKLAAQSGYRVAINYQNNQATAQAVVNQIVREGGQAEAFQADVADPASVERLFKAVDQAFGRLDVLVNNAGIFELFPIPQATPERIERSFRTNVFGLFYCASAAIERMSKDLGGQGGVIINVSSVAARIGSITGGSIYTASKAAVDGFNLSLAHEVGPQGIRVVGVRPGIIATDMQAARGGIDKAAEFASSATSLKRMGQPEEIAQAIVWLASDAASYVHGAMLDVSGGR